MSDHETMDFAKIENELLDLRDVSLDVHHHRVGITHRTVQEDTTEMYLLDDDTKEHKQPWTTTLTEFFLSFIDRMCCIRSQEYQDHPENKNSGY